MTASTPSPSKRGCAPLLACSCLSLDGLVGGANGELDWIRSWEDIFEILDPIDTCSLGRGMCPAYEHYWRAILKAPDSATSTHSALPFRPREGARFRRVGWVADVGGIRRRGVRREGSVGRHRAERVVGRWAKLPRSVGNRGEIMHP